MKDGKIEKINKQNNKQFLACISLSHNLRAQSLGGGDSGMKT